MRNITATSVLIVSLVSAILAAPKDHKSWTTIEVLEGGLLIAITNSERVLGQLPLQAAPWLRAFVSHRGDLVYLPQNLSPTDMNESGQVVGWVPSSPPAGHRTAAMWDHGTMVDLSTWPVAGIGLLPGARSGANAINNLGQAVGVIDEALPVVWSNGSAAVLSSVGFPSYAVDINDEGQVIGGYTKEMDLVHQYVPEYAVVWEGQTVRDLSSPFAGEQTREITRSVAINNRGQVVGFSIGADSRAHAVLWDNGHATVLVPGAVASIPTAINERGQVVGFVQFDDLRVRPWVWEDGELTELPSEALPGGAAAIDINNRGHIIGNGSDRDMRNKSVLWTR